VIRKEAPSECGNRDGEWQASVECV
jgi:hypothetical protein